MMGVLCQVPLRTVSESNSHTHWRVKAKRVAMQRRVVSLVLRPQVAAWKPMWPLVVSLTRVAPRALDDDNLRGCLKAARDAVADVLGIRDNDPRVTWTYAQTRGAPRAHFVRIEIETANQETASCF
jgi:hypothetical protein